MTDISSARPMYHVVIFYPDGTSTIYNNREKMTLEKAREVKDDILGRSDIKDCRIFEIHELERAIEDEEHWEAIIGYYDESEDGPLSHRQEI